MSSICQAFEANAWRKDLCSHCFKSKEEHEGTVLTFDPKTDRTDASQRYQSPASLLSSRSYLSSSTLRPLTSAANNERSSHANSVRQEGGSDVSCAVERDNNTKNLQGKEQAADDKKNTLTRANRSVNFHSGEVQVIGYGGDEYFYSDEDEITPTSAHSSDDEDDDFTEEERKIQTITQKNTSFNSVTRNLTDSSTVKTFVSHGISLPGEARSGTAPLVTIRPFVKETRPTELKINLVSPMRNGQLVGGEKTPQQESVRHKEEINNNATVIKNVKEKEDKWISSCENKDSFPRSEDVEKLVHSQPLSDSENDSKTSSKAQGNRITLSRKPPVLKEKPRIPIKPQTALHRLDRTLSPESKSVHIEKLPTPKSLAPMPPISPVIEPVLVDSRHVPLEVGEPLPSQKMVTEQQQTLNDNIEPPVKVQTKYISPSFYPLHSKGQINVRFVNITSSVNDSLSKKDAVESSQEDNTTSSSNLSCSLSNREVLTDEQKPLVSDAIDRKHKLGVLAQELNAVKRLDGLFLYNCKTETSDLPSVINEAKMPPSTPIKEDLSKNAEEKLDSPPLPRESTTQEECSDVLNRSSAFEVLRANLAGSLELTRMYPRYGVNKRQAPSPPLSNSCPSDTELPSESSTDSVCYQTPFNQVKDEPDGTLPEVQPPPPPPLPKTIPGWLLTKSERDVTCDSALRKSDSFSQSDTLPSASSFVRSGSISFVPGDSFDQDTDHHQRSISLTQIENEPEKPVYMKPPSIRKILRDRATQLFQPSDLSPKTSQRSADLPKSGRSCPEDKKSKSRFSLRKFFGLKKEMKSSSKTADTAEIPTRARPEILHPIDFHSGTVEVVTVKPSEVYVDPLRIYANPKSQDQTDSSFASSLQSSPNFSDQSSLAKSSSVGRPRPPPPPRSNSVDRAGKNAATPVRPVRPPPPKSAELLQLQKMPAPKVSDKSENSAQYANLADLGSGVQSKKPERSTSLRLIHSNTYESQPAEPKNDALHYECVAIRPNGTKCGPDDDGYIIPMRINPRSFSTTNIHRHSMSSFSPSNSFKTDLQANLYSTPLNRSGRPSLRQSRLDLHGKLEDHYGTVTGANFQALSQLLEQATTKRPIPAHLQELTNGNHLLQWDHFGHSLSTRRDYLQAGHVIFLPAQWRGHDVLLFVSECAKNDITRETIPFAPLHLASFQDNIPSRFFDTTNPSTDLSRGLVQVYPPGEIVTLKQLSHLFATEYEGDEVSQRSLCVLLQLTRAFLWLQEKKLSNINVESIVFYRENDDFHRLLWVEAEKETIYEAVQFAKSFSIGHRATPTDILTDLLKTCLPSSVFNTINSNGRQDLGRLKTCFEYFLFGPNNNAIGREDSQNTEIFQRWLDVERASILNELIRTQGLFHIKLSIFEELHLTFLLSTTAKCLYEASQMFPGNQVFLSP